MELGNDPVRRLSHYGCETKMLVLLLFSSCLSLDLICYWFALECHFFGISQQGRETKRDNRFIPTRKEDSYLKLCNECFFFFLKVLVHKFKTFSQNVLLSPELQWNFPFREHRGWHSFQTIKKQDSKLSTASVFPSGTEAVTIEKGRKTRLQTSQAFFSSYFVFLASLAIRSFHSPLFFVMYVGVSSCSGDSGCRLKRFWHKASVLHITYIPQS